MSSEGGLAAQRHGQPRSSISCEVRLSVERPAADPLVVTGKTVEISVGDVIMTSEEMVPGGHSCLVEFLNTNGRVVPESAAGTVRDITARGGGYLIRIQFSTPLMIRDC